MHVATDGLPDLDPVIVIGNRGGPLDQFPAFPDW